MVWSQADGVLLCAAAGAAALLVRETWSVVRLDEISRVVWDLLREPMATSALVSKLLERYDVPPERCRSDIIPILIELRTAGALLATDKTSG